MVPAAAHASRTGDSPLTAEESHLSDAALVRFERVFGRREAFAEILAVADGEPEVTRVIDLLLDVRYDSFSLRRLCAMTGFTVADFFAAYKKASIVRGHLQAAPIIASKIVGVVDDLMTRAQPHYLTCPSCRGTSTITPEPTKEQPNPQPEPCRSCIDGKQLVLPDLDRQKLALEVAELIKPKGGMVFNQANLLNTGGGRSSIGAPGALEQLQQAASAILFTRPTTVAPVQGEVVEDLPAADRPSARE
jgi:hypothetical protein